MFMPLGLVLQLMTVPITLGLLGGAVYILYQWNGGELVDERWLYTGIAFALLSAFGFLPSLLFRRAGRDEPKPLRSSRIERLKRPDGSELHVEIFGSDHAPTLILTHGWGEDGTVWYYAKKQLADQFRLIIWDLPGLGRSKKPKNGNYTTEKYAHDLKAVVALAGGQPVILVGHSMGAMVSLTFSRLFPALLEQQVAGLVLANGTFTNPLRTTILSKILLSLQNLLLRPVLCLIILLSPLLRITSWLSYLNGSSLLITEITGYTGKETRGQLNFCTILGTKASPEVLARGVLGMFRYNEAETLQNVSVPTLVIAGKSDIVTRPFASVRMSTDIPRSELVVLAPGGHMVFMERNEQFGEAVRDFSSACLT